MANKLRYQFVFGDCAFWWTSAWSILHRFPSLDEPLFFWALLFLSVAWIQRPEGSASCVFPTHISWCSDRLSVASFRFGWDECRSCWLRNFGSVIHEACSYKFIVFKSSPNNCHNISQHNIRSYQRTTNIIFLPPPSSYRLSLPVTCPLVSHTDFPGSESTVSAFFPRWPSPEPVSSSQQKMISSFCDKVESRW